MIEEQSTQWDKLVPEVFFSFFPGPAFSSSLLPGSLCFPYFFYTIPFCNLMYSQFEHDWISIWIQFSISQYSGCQYTCKLRNNLRRWHAEAWTWHNVNPIQNIDEYSKGDQTFFIISTMGYFNMSAISRLLWSKGYGDDCEALRQPRWRREMVKAWEAAGRFPSKGHLKNIKI